MAYEEYWCSYKFVVFNFYQNNIGIGVDQKYMYSRFFYYSRLYGLTDRVTANRAVPKNV